MFVDEDLLLVKILDPGTPAFITWEITYLGTPDVAKAIHNLGVERPQKILLKGTHESLERKWEYTHTNVWDCLYKVRAAQLHTHCRYYRLNREYVRAVRFRFQDLQYYSEFAETWHPLNAEECWGTRGVLVDAGPNGIMNAPFFIDKRFKQLYDVKADMADPQDLGYKFFFNEVFADG